MPEIAELPARWADHSAAMANELAEKGRQLAMAGKQKDALELFAKALTLDHKNPCALVCAAAAAAEIKAWDDALRFTTAALDLPLGDADRGVAVNNLGMVHYSRREYDEAMKCFAESMRLAPYYKQPVVSLGACLVLLDRVPEAFSYFDRANLMNPLDWEPIINRGILKLLAGDWDLGLPGYEHRPLQGDAAKVKWPVPRWQGEPLNGRAIIIWPDQGIGDSIWCHRLVAEVAKQGKVYLQMYELLEDILPIPPGVTLVRSGDPIASLHFQAPVMSLPYCLRLKPDTFPPPYGLKQKYIYSIAGTPPRRIGLCWSGNIHHKLDDLRSIPLAQMMSLPLADRNRVELYNLQHDVRPTDQAAFVQANFLNTSPLTFKELADRIAQLDLVITCDTGVLHVAGEMGVPTWAFIPMAPDFRWMQRGDNVPWYPSVKLYRNRQAKGGWDEVIGRMAADLKELLT